MRWTTRKSKGRGFPASLEVDEEDLKICGDEY
jgi:hypothetical protein